jgi:tRNA (guanine-N7-)-methyltransferase
MNALMSNFDILEIGPGRGEFLFSLASEHPFKMLAAIEYKKKRIEKLVARAEKRVLTNIQFFLGDARLVLPQDFSDESVGEIYILFSDPWPKRRHASHRLFQKDFVGELLRVLKPEGRVYIAHDDPNYVKQIRGVFDSFIQYFVYNDEGVEFTTFYAEKWKSEGRSLTSFHYRKIGCNPERDLILRST